LTRSSTSHGGRRPGRSDGSRPLIARQTYRRGHSLAPPPPPNTPYNPHRAERPWVSGFALHHLIRHQTTDGGSNALWKATGASPWRATDARALSTQRRDLSLARLGRDARCFAGRCGAKDGSNSWEPVPRVLRLYAGSRSTPLAWTESACRPSSGLRRT
jgi:hypothetical protein